MSVINSGLGWKCDSDYFVNEADAELAVISTDTAYKALQGAAITAQITNGNSTQLFLISTVENNAKLKMNSSLRSVYSVSVGGETWYISLSYMSSSVTSDFPLITASKGESLNDTTPENLAKIISEITEAAEVVFAKKVPTVDYIHQYIEGVEAETASRVNGVKNMITPVFDTQTVYAVGDYCIYNNGLYKCTTAHTGTWSANDFTSVSVMDEIKNTSGGGSSGGLPDTTKIVTFKRNIDDLTQYTITKDITFPLLGDTGCGELSFSGYIWGIDSAYHRFLFTGRTQLYLYYFSPEINRKYMIPNYDMAQSGSSPVVSPFFECYSNHADYSDGSNAIYTRRWGNKSDTGEIKIQIGNIETDTVHVKVTLMPYVYDSRPITYMAHVVINAIFS